MVGLMAGGDGSGIMDIEPGDTVPAGITDEMVVYDSVLLCESVGYSAVYVHSWHGYLESKWVGHLSIILFSIETLLART